MSDKETVHYNVQITLQRVVTTPVAKSSYANENKEATRNVIEERGNFSATSLGSVVAKATGFLDLLSDTDYA